jgi:[acyl-carrier-protein] S-malonyltransferase
VGLDDFEVVMASQAVLFAGQGAQFVGMGWDLFDRSPAAGKIFEKADEVLGFELSEIIFNGPEERLTETDVSQPAILTMSIAAVEAAREAGWDGGAAAAGLSLGEYSALVFAGVLSFEDGVRLVRKRGEFMTEAARQNPGGMLSVIGLDEEALRGVVEAASSEGVICMANLNCPGQIVLSGETGALEKAAPLAEEAGAMKTVMLNVAGAFHSPLMEPARERLAEVLDGVEIGAPDVPVLFNRTADFADDAGAIRRLLLEQLVSPVLWDQSMRKLLADGVESFVEIGPGRVLTGLMKRINRRAPMRTVGDFDAASALAGS